ncbi:restriction endonuclease subunit S [Flavobacterium sp. GT3P67]|uniref:restriction endonuclease subunit S n=1 Tax=Flavobacterium sp. GT3P67 TaxID=2541722 RepID=UPI001042A90A|nr:restriction endonuclease subunit S [Flavobacterium sp. GT3P67]TDE51437.1 restriction endonuclease subunit S [Flavobacterium sp. GT3P67]
MQKVKLDQLCNMQSGGTPSRGKSEYYNGTIPWSKISDLEKSNDGYIYKTEEHITLEGLKSINSRFFKKGTLLLAMYGSVGKTAIAKIELSTNQAILGINLKDEKQLNIKYLRYWFLTIKEQLLNRAVGVALSNISLGIVKDLEIPLPPLPAQQKIANILDKADELRQYNKQLIKKYDALTQSLFLDMFGDPVKNEKGWEKIGLGEISKMASGSTPSRTNENNFKGNIPWIKTTEVNGKIINDTLEKISEEALENSSCRLFPKGSIVIAMYGQGKTRGQIGILGIEAATNQACCVLKPSNKMNFQFLYYTLSMLYDDLRSLGRGGNQPNLNLGLLKNYELINPPINRQNQFADRVELIETQKLQVQEALAKSEELFQSLLQQAFKGELN